MPQLNSYFSHLAKLPCLLSCGNVDMRIAAGETMALLFELARDIYDVSMSVFSALLVIGIYKKG